MTLRSRHLLAAVLAVALLSQKSEQYGSGAPERACVTMLPVHGDITPQTSPAPYTLRASAAQVRQGSDVTVTLSSPTATAISGFLVQARSVQNNKMVLGTWSKFPELTRTSTCNGTADSVTHTSPDPKGELSFSWTAPTNFLGAVVFKATSGTGYAQFWSNIESTLVEVVSPSTPISSSTPSELPSTMRPSETVRPPVYTTSSAPQQIDPFYDGCGSTKLCFGSTSTCLAKKNCVAAVTVLVKGDIYTFSLKGTENPAFVAIGLSDDKLMGDDSSMECENRNGVVSQLNSWTTQKSAPSASRSDVPQDITRLIRSSFTDGILECTFTRDVRSTIRGKEFDLSKNKYNILIVAGDKLKPDSVGFHDKVYTSTEQKVSLSDVAQLAGASKLLLRLHGAFMVAAWIGTASCGILLARYFRQTWVGKQLGGKDIWFAWHRIFMVLTWLLTIASFIIILVDVGGWGGTGDNPHAIIGVVTVVLCFLQPIGAFFRPHPNTSKRPLFNWAHWFLGNAAHILGIVTIFFAVYLTKAELPEWTVYILVAFVAFHVLMHVILSITMCVSDGRISNGRVNSFPMKDLMTNNRQSVNNDRKMDAPHAVFRKLLLGVYVAITILFVIALICLISLAPIEEAYDSVSKAISGSM